MFGTADEINFRRNQRPRYSGIGMERKMPGRRVEVAMRVGRKFVRREMAEKRGHFEQRRAAY